MQTYLSNTCCLYCLLFSSLAGGARALISFSCVQPPWYCTISWHDPKTKMTSHVWTSPLEVGWMPKTTPLRLMSCSSVIEVSWDLILPFTELYVNVISPIWNRYWSEVLGSPCRMSDWSILIVHRTGWLVKKKTFPWYWELSPSVNFKIPISFVDSCRFTLNNSYTPKTF